MKSFTSRLFKTIKLFTAALLLNTNALNAQQLITDSLFGNNGEVFSTSTAAQDGVTTNILKQPDGKLIVCGNTYGGANEFWNNMFRIDACGKVDSTFGNNGMVMHKFDQRNIGWSYLLKDDGKIMVVGTQASSNAGSQQFPFIARYNADGSPDTTFATLGTNKIINSPTWQFTGIYKANNGKWLCTDLNVLMRFDSMGVEDPTFGTNGLVTFPAPYNTYNGRASVMRSDNKIIYASRANLGSGYLNTYMCYDTLGVVDTTFGSNGFTVEGSYYTSSAPQLFLQSNDKLVATSANSTETAVITARYNTNGTLDTTFGTNGYLTFSGLSVARLQYLSALDNDNFLISFKQNGITPEFYKITADGLIDSTFSLNGSKYYQFVSGERAQMGLLESNGDLIMASSAYYGPRMVFSKFTLNSAVPHITQNFTTLNSNVIAAGVSFQWYLNGTAVSGATDSTYVFNQNGIYSVEVTNSYGCKSLLDSITVINAGIKTVNNLNGVSFFPNPVQNDLTVTNSSGKELTLKLFDVTGKLISEEKTSYSNYNFSMRTLEPGIYIVEMQSKNNVSRNKIVKL